MEDGVPGAERLLHPMNQEIGNKEREAKGEENKASGFLNHLISNLVAADEPDKETNEEEDNHEQKETVAEGKGEERGGGLLDHLISNLVSPPSPKTAKGEVFGIHNSEGTENERSRSDEDAASSPRGGGGLIKNVISNLFHPSEADELTENEKNNEEEIVKTAEENDHENVKTGEEGGGFSIIDNIVSHLPTSLREDVAPTTDEASILIHSIIHD